MAQKFNNWLKLDNSAKIYPFMMNKSKQNLFRISMVLNEKIEPNVLQEALNICINRFPSFKVRLLKGVFWYYFDEINNQPLIYEDKPRILHKISPTNCNGYYFRVLYHENRISLEFFHAISDGAGAMEFLKSLVYTYLIKKGYAINTEQKILTPYSPIQEEEIEDSFIRYYKNKKLKDLKIDSLKGREAYKISGILFDDNGKGLIEASMDANSIYKLAKEYNATITEFLGGLVIFSIYKTKCKNEDYGKFLEMFVPANMRKKFPSISLRNFSLFARVGINIKEDLTLEECVKATKDAIKRDLNPELLLNKISTTVKAERLLILRFCPLFLKTLIFKISNLFFGKNKKTLTFSNLGIINLPSDFAPYIKHTTFNLNSSVHAPFNIASITTFNELNLSFTRAFTDTNIEKFMLSFLIQKGINVTVRSNYWEVFDEM